MISGRNLLTVVCFGVYVALLHIVYVIGIHPIWGGLGFAMQPTGESVLVSLVVALCCAPFLLRCRAPSDFFIAVCLVLIVAPSTVLYAYAQLPFEFLAT